MLDRHNTLIFAKHRDVTDCGEVTTGPIRAIVYQVMLEETAHWHEQSELELVATDKALRALKGEAGTSENFVQEIFEINFRLTSANFYGNQPDSPGLFSLCDSGVVLVQQCTLSKDLC